MSASITNEYWINLWSEGKINFHLEKMHSEVTLDLLLSLVMKTAFWKAELSAPTLAGRQQRNIQWALNTSSFSNSLEKHLEKFIAGRKGIKIFFPLCGKTVDMRILADQGHHIVGVDVAEQAFREFFTDQNLEYSEESLKNIDGKLFQAMDGRIKLYCMDIYLFTKEMEGQFNAIWDRASLVAINIPDRTKYVQLIKDLMLPDCRYIVAAMQYDINQCTGPPFNMTEKDIMDLYPNCTIEEFDENDRSYLFKHRGLNNMMEKMYLLQPKTDSDSI